MAGVLLLSFLSSLSFPSKFFFAFFPCWSPWSFVETSLVLTATFFFFFLASSAFFSFSFSSLMELPPSPPCEVETDGCFLFLIRGISFSSSSSSS
jgi:hypothetical protein